MRDVESKIHMVGGNKVRSLLEKRWILFFQYLGIHFEYEPERFPDGVSNIGYLPDMLIHEKLYVEIKPSTEILAKEIKKPYGFVRNTGKRLIIIIGNPPGERVFSVIKRDDGSITYRDVTGFSFKTLQQKTDIDHACETAAANYAINTIDMSMATPIARCLDAINQAKRNN